MPFNRQIDKEDVVHIYNGILLSHQKERLPNMDGTGGDYTKGNKSNRERQLSYSFTYSWNIRNSRDIVRRRKGKMKGRKTEGEMNHERLWTPGNKLRVSDGWGDGVIR